MTATFALPAELSATRPPEARGLSRDDVRLLVASPERISHARFRDLGTYLHAGDLVVVNTSATMPAAVDGRRTGGLVVVHFSTPHEDGTWTVELRQPDGSGPVLDAVAGELIRLPAGVTVALRAGGPRLWRTYVAVEGAVADYLARHGRPITYGYLHGHWPLPAYQPVFATEPGSAEMASAGRPFTDQMVTGLATRGVRIAPVLLHCGVSSLEAGEPPQPERYRVTAETARIVNDTRRAGGRVVAVGTTVTRALETVARPDGRVVAGAGWTDLVLGPDRPARVVSGLVTGWHEPSASHLHLLDAVAGADLVHRAYDAALAGRYLWHEFGDSCLLLP